VHGAGDVSSNRWLSCSHPRVGYRLIISDAGLPLSKNGYLSQRTPRVHLSLAAVSSVLHRQSVVQRSGGERCFPCYTQNTSTGTSGNETLNGTAGNDLILTGGETEDTVSRGLGDDVIIVSGNSIYRQSVSGGAGNDMFLFNEGGGARVHSFTQGEDRIDLSRWGTYSIEDITITNNVIRYDGEVTRVYFGSTGTLFSEDFIFA
jgi:Ca2+-binding RTX toxin-like protein